MCMHILWVLSLWRSLTRTVWFLPSIINSPVKRLRARKLVFEPQASPSQKAGLRQVHSPPWASFLTQRWPFKPGSQGVGDRANDDCCDSPKSISPSQTWESYLFLKIRSCCGFLYLRSQCGGKKKKKNNKVSWAKRLVTDKQIKELPVLSSHLKHLHCQYIFQSHY